MTPEEIKALTETIKILTEMAETKPNEWLPVYAALCGAVAGAIASFFPTWFLEKHRDRRYSDKIQNCLLAEIYALLEIIKHRCYLTSIRAVIEHLKAQPRGTKYAFTVIVQPHYSRVYEENCRDIGLVRNDIAVKIVVFHQLIDSLVQDVQPGGVMSVGATIESYEEMEKIFSRAIQIGNDLIEKHNHLLHRTC